jgi:hypothetical protein
MIRIERLSLIFKYGTLSPQSALLAVRRVLEEHHLSELSFVANEGRPMKLSAAVRQIEDVGENNFRLERRDSEFDLSPIRNFEMDMFEITQNTNSPVSWDKWAERFIGSPDFVMAWVVDSDYDYWQNAQDPLEYIAGEKPYGHLPTRSNGLPYPLQKSVIDTSANPGRSDLNRGYVEAIGAVMWLGEAFWRRTSGEKGQLEEFPWLVSSPQPEVTRVQAAEQCFVSESTHLDRQLALRSVLYRNRPLQ